MKRYLKYRSLSSLIPFALGVSLAACGASAEPEASSVNALAGADAPPPTVGSQDYKGGASADPGVVDVGTLQQALTALTGNVDVSVGGFKSGIASGAGLAAGSGKGGGAAQSVDVACRGGGRADVDGHMNMAAIDVSLAITFSACETSTGTIVDGNLDFSQTRADSPDATGPFQVETLFVGDVNLSGSVNVSCPVDLNVLVDETGRAVAVQGTFCNQDAGALAMQLQPQWQN